MRRHTDTRTYTVHTIHTCCMLIYNLLITNIGMHSRQERYVLLPILFNNL